MPIRLVDRASGLSKVVELTQLMRHARQRLRDRLPDRMLAIGNDADHRYTNSIGDTLEQRGQVIGGSRQQALGHHHPTADAIPDDSQDLVPDVGLQAVECEDDAALRLQNGLKSFGIDRSECPEFIESVEEVGDGAS